MDAKAWVRGALLLVAGGAVAIGWTRLGLPVESTAAAPAVRAEAAAESALGEPRAPTAEPTRSDETMLWLELQLDLLHARQRELEEELAWLRTEDSRALEPPEASEPLPRILERQLSEPDEPAWSRSAERAIRDVYAPVMEAAAELRMLGVTCRRTLCRAEWSAEPGARLDALVRTMPWDGSALFVPQGPASRPTGLVAYIGREGHVFPGEGP